MTGSRSAVLALLLSALPAAGKDLDPKVVSRISRPGAFSVPVGEAAQFRVPQGFRWVAADKLPDLGTEAGLTVAGTETGAIFPDDGKWLAFVLPVKADPLAGTDPKALNPDALRTWQERYSAGRRKYAGSASKVVGWTHPPAWDAEKRWLTMGVRLTADSGEGGPDVVRYQLFVYDAAGPSVCLEAYTPVGEFHRPPQELPRLAGEVTFPKPEVVEEPESPVFYYAKIVGGGLAGSVLVVLLLWPRNRARAPGRAPARRGPGLPR